MTTDEPPTGAAALDAQTGDPPRPAGPAADPLANPVALARRRRTLVLGSAALLLVGAVGSFALSAWTTPAATPEETEATADDGAPGPLAAHPMPRKPVPAGAVDVEVVERGTQTPVAGIEVRLQRVLSDDDADASFAVTDADGRARLVGEFPAFVELESDAWTSDPRRRPVDEASTARIEVVRRTPFVLSLVDETTGRAVPGWTLGGVDGATTATATADDGGAAALPRRRRAPELVAATDGKRRVHLFLLATIPGRDGARLEVPAAERATTVRAVDETGAGVAGAVVAIGGPSTGVAIPCDERGEATLEYGARAVVPVVVSAPGRASRALRLDGAPSVVVTLFPTSARRLRLRAADGTRVPDGTRVRAFTRGPSSYAVEGAGRVLAATVVDEVALVAGLPDGAFEALVSVEGAGPAGPSRISTLARVRGGDDASAPIELVVGPGRRFVLVGIPGEPDGPPPTAIVRVDGRRACGADVREGASDLVETFAHGREVDALGACFVVRGPEAEIFVPRSTEPRRVEVLTTAGRFACLVLGSEEASDTRVLAFVDARAPTGPPTTTLCLKWDDGGAAELLSFDVRRDERGADATAAFTDSTGTAVVRLDPGRYVVEATAPDGGRYAGDGPLLVPSAGPIFVRLRAIER